MNNKSIEEQVLEMIIDKLGLDDIEVSEVNYDAPIFESFDDGEDEGLGLDSVDALELVVGLKEVFNIKVTDQDMDIFKSINTIADYVREKGNVDNEGK